MIYYVCTTVVGLHHIRPAGEGGLRPDGPADTKSLCGRVVGGPKVKDLRVFKDTDAFKGCLACVKEVMK